MKKKIATVDYETESIEDRPEYPPIPVGVAIKVGRKKEYLAWGHPTENNCTKAHAKRTLKQIYKDYIPLFHHAAFDIEVGMIHMDLPFPKEYHDTLFLAFLHDPRDDSLSLKPMADKYLDMPPDEQEAMKDWILTNVKEALPSNKKNPWGKYICKTPGKLCAKYAIGDVVRTFGMFEYLYPIVVVEMGMQEAYDRERRVMPIFGRMSQDGVRVNRRKLKKDLRQWERQREETAKKIRRKLKVGADCNIDSGAQLADAMEMRGMVDEWIMTPPSKTFPHGQRSTSRDNLVKVCTDKKFLDLQSFHGVLNTYIGTFGTKWLATAERTGGYIYPTFNQVRSTSEHGSKSRGTRTGRPSSENPNFLNVPRNPNDPEIPWTMQLPRLRDYIIPDEGCVFIGRDYNQQELRITAHFEDGMLMKAYLDNPKLDIHTFVQELIHEKTGILFPRKFIKIVNFGIVYGMGVPGLVLKIQCSVDEAKSLKKSHAIALPGIKQLNKDIVNAAHKGEPIVTWGGRVYYTEEPKMVKGKYMSFEYKLLNYLIQGSAADCTKQAMINLDDSWDGRLRLQVYDELLGCAEKGTEKKQMKLMKEAMEDVKFDVPMLSDGKISAISWGKMRNYKD